MKLLPNSLSRMGHRSLLKLNAASPTILVVSGVGGLLATAVLAAKASRQMDPILDNHHKARLDLQTNPSITSRRDEQKALLHLYTQTGIKLTKLYGPALIVGTTSTISVLGGHKVLRGRHVATMAAYSGLIEQFNEYRGRVAATLGDKAERDIYDGAHGEWKEDPDHKGEYKLEPVFGKSHSYLRPWFDEGNVNWTHSPESNYAFLKGVQRHMNNLLEHRGHVFLNDVYDALGMERCREGAIAGWLHEDRGDGDGYIDFGFMTSNSPDAVAFRNRAERSVQLNFNIDGSIWDRI